MSLLLRSPFAGELEQTVMAAGFFPETMMTASTDVWLAAQGMLAAHADSAARECETLIESRRKRGDQTGVEKWTLVLASIRQLQESD